MDAMTNIRINKQLRDEIERLSAKCRGLESEIENLREKLKIAEEALHTGIMSLKTGYPEYDSDDTLEILSEALAKIQE